MNNVNITEQNLIDISRLLQLNNKEINYENIEDEINECLSNFLNDLDYYI